jgi:hypothetical protein
MSNTPTNKSNIKNTPKRRPSRASAMNVQPQSKTKEDGELLELEPNFKINLNDLVKVNMGFDLELLKTAIQHLVQEQKRQAIQITNLKKSSTPAPANILQKAQSIKPEASKKK